jgi:methionine-rich copper-binding protein CopC
MSIRAFYIFTLFLALLSHSSVLAQEPSLQKVETPLPDTVAAGMKEHLEPTALTVTVEGQVFEFWMRKDLPTTEGSQATLGVNFPAIARSTVAGVVRIHRNWTDYKSQTIPAGVYTLRYEILPSDGNHMGVSPYRDYLLLVPAGEDQDISASYNYEQLMALSRKSAGTNHPGVLALFPVWDEITEAQVIKNEMDQWTLAIPLGSLQLGLVIIGHGEG